MKKKREFKQKIVLLTLVILVVAVAIFVNISNSRTDLALRSSLQSEELDLSAEEGEIPTYTSYIDGREDLDMSGTEEVVISALDYTEASMDGLEVVEDGLLTTGSGSVTWEVNVPKTGTYRIDFEYFPVADSNMSIVRSLQVNGSVPFQGSESLSFERVWEDESKDFLMQTSTNQGTPTQVQASVWLTTQAKSMDGTVTGYYQYYLEAGTNTLTLESVQASMILRTITLVPDEGIQTYEEYIAGYEAEGAARISGDQLGEDGYIMKQAEDSLYKSSSTLQPVNDRTSAVTVPYHPSNIVMNTIGGSTWSSAGMFISWEIEAPASGFYRIATRFMQADNRDFYSIRELKINGEVPFEEAACLKFHYDSGFQVDYLGSEEGEAYYFYLEEGVNTLTMTVVLGDLSYAYEQTYISVDNLTALYRRLTSIMGTDPDQYRDYDILSSIPDMVDILKQEYVRLTSVAASVGDTIEDSTKARSVTKLLLQMEELIAKPDDISLQLSTYNDNLTALADWVMGLGSQPLQLDYILLCGEGCELPRAEGNFFQNVSHTFLSFLGSFTNDYRVVSAETAGENKKTLEVWVATSSRDEYDIIQTLINRELADASYVVNFSMVSADTVMPATLTGNGPDVAIQLNYSMPTNFAFRGAAYDLTQFEDFEEVASRFSSDGSLTGAMEYFEYEGGYYALPGQISFPVMFVRTDILAELGLDVPQTWDELLDVLPYLQAENMSAYFWTTETVALGGSTSSSSKPINPIFMSTVYQNGLELYRDGGVYSNLDNSDILQIFKDWTEYYTKESFDLSANVVTRFRTGEMPIIIHDYTYQNSIRAAAPEIEGAWDIYPILGVEKEDGTIDRTSAGMVSACMILKNIVETNDTANEAWDFLKWWTDADTQYDFAVAQKAILGDAANYPVANYEAIMRLAEENNTADTMEAIMSSMRGVPQVPGGYLVGREVENAFLSVVNDMVDPVDTLYAKVHDLNSELTVKREEFGLTE